MEKIQAFPNEAKYLDFSAEKAKQRNIYQRNCLF